VEEEPAELERGANGRKENERRKKKIGGAHRGKMVISLVSLTSLAQNMDGMAYVSTNFECIAYMCLGTFSCHIRN
jgi:hypothetical protein